MLLGGLLCHLKMFAGCRIDCKPKSSFRHLKGGIQDFHMNYVLVPADKAANNVVVV